MADGKCPGLPLEQRIGSIRDGEVTNLGPAIRSKPLTIQPTRKSDMTDDDIIARLRCSYADPPCESCTFCTAKAEIERLRAELRTERAEVKRLRAADQYVKDLGVDWCVLHHGVRDKDSDRCDAFDWADGDDILDEDGEYLPCNLRPLAYWEARRER